MDAPRRYKPSRRGPVEGFLSSGRVVDGMARSKRQVAADLQKEYNVPELRSLARRVGAKRQRGDSKKQTAWRIVNHDYEAARDAC